MGDMVSGSVSALIGGLAAQVVNDLCDETAERIKALTQELGQAASIELIQASDIPVPEPTSGVNTSSLDYIKFQNADRIVVLRAEHAVLKVGGYLPRSACALLFEFRRARTCGIQPTMLGFRLYGVCFGRNCDLGWIC